MNTLELPGRIKVLKISIGYLLCAAFSLLSPNAFAESPTLEFSTPFAGQTPKSLALNDQDEVVSTDGLSLSIGSVTQISRTIQLTEEVRNVFNLSGNRLFLKNDFIMRADGKALLAPSTLYRQGSCPYFVVDTFTGATVSGSYAGVPQYYSHGGSATNCHNGLSANPASEQFALAPAITSRDIYLIAYDATRTTLSASLNETTEWGLAGRMVYLSATTLAALYNVDKYAYANLSQKFVLFNLSNSQQTILPAPQGDYKLSLIKKADSHTLLLDKSPAVYSPSSSKVLFDTDTQIFTTLRSADDYYSEVWSYRDALLEDSLGQSPLFYEGYFSSCSAQNGGLKEDVINVCASSGSDRPWTALQCFFRKSAYSGDVFRQAIGATNDRKLVISTGDKIETITFPSSTVDGLENFCTQLVMQESSSCGKYLKPGADTLDVAFKKRGLRKTCTMKFQLINQSSPAPEGSIVRLFKKSIGKARRVLTRKTDKDGNVSFKMDPKVFASYRLPYYSRAREFPKAIFSYSGDDSLRAAEFVIQPR